MKNSTTLIFVLLLLSCPPKTEKSNLSWLGEWKKQEWQNGAVLNITTVNTNELEFSLTAYSGGNVGTLNGKATVQDTIALFSQPAKFDTCQLKFVLDGDSLINIIQQRGVCAAGLGVGYSGEYINSKMLTNSEAKKPGLVKLGMLNNEIEDAIFRSLVGDAYELFVNSTQLTVASTDLDSLSATVKSSSVRGLATIEENIIMKDSSNTFWAAVINDNKVFYFTNKKADKMKLPETIEHWRERFKEYEVVF